MKTLWQITAPHFTAGVVAEAGTVTEAADIVRYMIGRSLEWVQQYARGKRWRMAEITDA